MKSVKYPVSLPQPFASTTALQQAYAEGLTRLLASDVGLGSYILALANAAQDASLWQLLERRLEERHYHLAALVTTRLRQGRPIDVPDDDLMVFLKLMAIGFGDGLCKHTRQAGPWEVSFNPLRALRPPRASRVRVEGLSRPFDPEAFISIGRVWSARGCGTGPCWVVRPGCSTTNSPSLHCMGCWCRNRSSRGRSG